MKEPQEILEWRMCDAYQSNATAKEHS